MIKVITGMRRCGKSYLLFNLFSDALKAEGVDEQHIVKVNLEDRRNKALRDPDKLLEYIDSRLQDDKMYYILLSPSPQEEFVNSGLFFAHRASQMEICSAMCFRCFLFQQNITPSAHYIFA